MKIVIGLNQTDFLCLRDKIPDDSPLRQVFKPWQNDEDENGYVEFKQSGPGIPLTAEFQIHCSKEEGEQLLAFAKKHCQSAVPPVNAALYPQYSCLICRPCRSILRLLKSTATT
jgi:hypothetical protein